MWLDSLFDNIFCWIDDIVIKIDLLTFRINQKIKDIEK